MTTQIQFDIEQLAKSIEAEIYNEGLADCQSFEELHDYCDANMLGDSPEMFMQDDGEQVVDAAQKLVGQRLKEQYITSE